MSYFIRNEIKAYAPCQNSTYLYPLQGMWFAILFIKALNIDFFLILISLNVEERLPLH